jgi:hypothetical protein
MWVTKRLVPGLRNIDTVEVHSLSSLLEDLLISPLWVGSLYQSGTPVVFTHHYGGYAQQQGVLVDVGIARQPAGYTRSMVVHAI